MKNLQLLISLPFIFMCFIAAGIILLFGIPALMIGGDKAKDIIKDLLDFISR